MEMAKKLWLSGQRGFVIAIGLVLLAGPAVLIGALPIKLIGELIGLEPDRLDWWMQAASGVTYVILLGHRSFGKAIIDIYEDMDDGKFR